MRITNKWGRGVFLNEAWEGDSGAVTCHIQVENYTTRKTLEAEVIVWDCDRKVRLDFNARPENLEQRRKKIDRFEKVTQDFIRKYRSMLDKVEGEVRDE